jgi:hypothetical protein
MATRKNKLTTVFDGDDRPFQKKVKRVQQAAKKTSAIIGKMGGVIGGLGLSMGMARTAQHFDRIAKVATRMNMSVESLQRLSLAAELSGSSLSQLQGIMTRLERRTGEALQNTTGSQAKRFKELNIEVESFSKLSPEDKILAIADAFNKLGGSEKSIASLMGLLDTEVRELIPLLQNGSKGIEDMVKGITVLNKEQIRSMEAANDGLAKLQQFSTTLLGGGFSGLSQIFGTAGSFFRRPDLMKDFGPEYFAQGPGDKDAKFRAYSYRSLFQTPENRALMEKHNTGDLRIARKKEQLELDQQEKENKEQQRKVQFNLLKRQVKDKDITGLFQRTTTGKILQGAGGLFEKITGQSFGDKAKSVLRGADFQFRKAGGFEAIQEGIRQAKQANKSVLLDNNAQVFSLIKKEEEARRNQPSQTSGRFGEFLASATLGSGRGRSVSQSKGIRIQGLDKSVLIQEAMKKALEDLVANTTER